MTLSEHDLDRMADDMYKNRRLTESTYCAQCGYNLRTLPYVYTCPECGNEYNARPVLRHGIFSPHDVVFPFKDLLAAMVSAVGVFLLTYGAPWPPSMGRVVMVLTLAVLGVMFIVQGITGMRRFLQSSRVAQRIMREEMDTEGDEDGAW
ncbi:MAG: hypothetical protein PVI86_04180 [Phycisphaerae bacterium]|jgi:hypothetical protein